MNRSFTLRSFIIRVEAEGENLRLKLQHIQSGELREFTEWEEFVNYAKKDLRNSAQDGQKLQEDEFTK